MPGRDRPDPVRIEQRGCGGAVRQRDGIAHRPAVADTRIEPGVAAVEVALRTNDVGIAPLGVRPQCITDDALHRVHDVIVEHAIHHPRLDRGIGIGGHEPHRAGMMRVEVVDDRARLEHRPVTLDE